MVKKRILMLAEEQKFGLIMQIRQNLTQVFAFLAFLKIALLSVSRNTPGLDRGEFDLFSTGTVRQLWVRTQSWRTRGK